MKPHICNPNSLAINECDEDGCRPTNIRNNDGFLDIQGSGSFNVDINIITHKLEQFVEGIIAIHERETVAIQEVHGLRVNEQGYMEYYKNGNWHSTEVDLTGYVHNPTYNHNTHILTLPTTGGQALVIDLPIEQLIEGMSFDSGTNELVLTLQNGQTQRVPLNTLVVGLASETWVRNNAVMLTGNQTVAGNKTFSGTTSLARPQSSRAPTADNDLANKAYVDSRVTVRSLVKPPSSVIVHSGETYTVSLPPDVNPGSIINAVYYSAGSQLSLVFQSYAVIARYIHFVNAGKSGFLVDPDTHYIYVFHTP